MKSYLLIICITLVLSPVTQAATLSEAKLAIRSQDFDQAVRVLMPLAKQGDREAQYHLAVMYRNGQGVREDNKKAVHWMRPSAKQQYKRAQYSQAVFFDEGIAVKQDRQKAQIWSHSPANQRHRNASKRIKALQ